MYVKRLKKQSIAITHRAICPSLKELLLIDAKAAMPTADKIQEYVDLTNVSSERLKFERIRTYKRESGQQKY